MTQFISVYILYFKPFPENFVQRIEKSYLEKQIAPYLETWLDRESMIYIEYIKDIDLD